MFFKALTYIKFVRAFFYIQEIHMNKLTLNLIEEYNRGQGTSRRLSPTFVEMWDDETLEEWKYKHFHYHRGKQLTIEQMEELNLEKIKGMDIQDVIVGFSGGKDSVATTIQVCELFTKKGFINPTIHVVFSDTGNESNFTYSYVELFSQKLYEKYGVKIITLKPKLPFFDLVIKKGMFPVSTRRFCTEHLKLIPISNYTKQVATMRHLNCTFDEAADASEKVIVEAMKSRREHILMCQGTRRSESLPRKYTPQLEFDADWGLWQYRPLCYVKSLHDIFEMAGSLITVEDVVCIYEKHRPTDQQTYEWGLKRIQEFGYGANPHYALGFTRLGCAPCFMSRKMNIRLIGLLFPEKLQQIRDTEADIGSTFFWRGKVPQRFHDKEWIGKDGKVWSICSIDSVVQWSKTKHYSRTDKPEEDLYKNIPKLPTRAEALHRQMHSELEPDETCGLLGGLCE